MPTFVYKCKHGQKIEMFVKLPSRKSKHIDSPCSGGMCRFHPVLSPVATTFKFADRRSIKR